MLQQFSTQLAASEQLMRQQANQIAHLESELNPQGAQLTASHPKDQMLAAIHAQHEHPSQPGAQGQEAEEPMRAREEAKASPEHGPTENSPPRSSEQSTETTSLRKTQDQESNKFQPNARSSPIFQGGLDWSDHPDGGSLPLKETRTMTTRPTSTIPASGKADGGRPISIDQLPATWKHSKPTTVPQFTAGPRGVQSLLSIKATLMLCGLWYVIIPGVTDEYLNQQCWAVLTMALAGAAAHLKEKHRDPNDPQALWDAMRKKALGETHASAFIAKQKLAAVRYDDNG